MTASSLAPPRTLVLTLAVGLALTGCAGVPGRTSHKAPEPQIGMKPIPNPPEDAPRAPSASAPKAAAPARRTPRPAKAPATAAAAAAAAPRAAAQPSANPARAAQLRAAGLEQLNRGSVERAVTLLRQASQLDPTNTLIQRDLERAVRISQAVQAKSR